MAIADADAKLPAGVTYREAVDTILRLDWAQMRVPPDMLTSNAGGLVIPQREIPRVIHEILDAVHELTEIRRTATRRVTSAFMLSARPIRE